MMLPPAEVSPIDSVDSLYTNHDKGKKWGSNGGGRSSSFRFTLPFCALLAIFVLLHQPIYNDAARTGPGAYVNITVEEVKEFLDTYNTQRNMTYYQLQLWFENQTKALNHWITPDLHPRLYPFCVTYNMLSTNPQKLLRRGTDSHLYKFKNIFEQISLGPDLIDRFYHFNVSRDSQTENKTFIKDIKLSRITGPDKDMVNMRQWFHVTVVTSGLKGLFVQSLAGPVGLPAGEFSLEFHCQDTPDNERSRRNIDDLGEIQYCHYRPKANIFFPNVYVAYTTERETNFHFHFRYTDITCMETPYVQFLFIAVNDFKALPIEEVDFQLLFSPVYVNTASDTKDGTPYPWYPAWKDNMACHLLPTENNEEEKLKLVKKYHPEYNPDLKKASGDHKIANLTWEQSTVLHRIQANEEYDACTLHKKIPRVQERFDPDRLECPPGPFICSQSYKKIAASGEGAATNAVTELRNRLVRTEYNNSKCFPCAAPACRALGFSRYECLTGRAGGPIHINDTQILENSEDLARNKAHGMLASLACLVLLPVANFIARFYKEVCRNCMCGNGPWIILHVVLHMFSLVLLWVSIGPVVSSIESYQKNIETCNELYDDIDEAKKCAVEKSVSNPHVPLGIIVFLFQNVTYLFGFFRAANNKIRWIQTLLHSQVGYLVFLIAVLSAVLAVVLGENNCGESTAYILVLCLVSVCFFIIGCVLDFMTDKRVGITPGRKIWPIMEPVKLDRRGPMDLIKWLVFALYVVLSMVIWLMIVISSNYAVTYDAEKFDPNEEGIKTLYDSFQNNSALRGIFGECGKLI